MPTVAPWQWLTWLDWIAIAMALAMAVMLLSWFVYWCLTGGQEEGS